MKALIERLEEAFDPGKKMSLKAWKRKIEALAKKVGRRGSSDYSKVRYDEQGQHGWTRLGMDDKGPTLTPRPKEEGLHWIDASPMTRSQHLYGTYYVNSGAGKVYYSNWEWAKGKGE